MVELAENKKIVKPENSRLNVFYILQILERYTDDRHPLSVAQIREKLMLSLAIYPWQIL